MPSPPVDDDSNKEIQLAEPAMASLSWLTNREMAEAELPPPPRIVELNDRYERRHPIGPTAAGRFRSLVRYEARSRQLRIATPAWSPEGAIPGLIIAQRYVGGDAFGSARQTAELDAALRRAVALLELLEMGERVEAWPRPIRPERGGLWLLDARYGSLELLWTVYGTIVSVATSTPVSLASFASLAWQSSKSASRMARRWVVRSLEPGELADRPSAAESAPSITHDDDVTWQERATKSLIPFFKQAVSDGRGLDFRTTGPSGELRLIVPPRANTEITEKPSG